MGKRGPRPGTAKKGATSSIRLAPALKRQLLAAAKKNGNISFSEEVTQRLELSFSTLTRREAEFGDLTTYAFFRLLARAFQQIYEETGHRWSKHPFAYRHAIAAAGDLLPVMRPPGEADLPDDMPALDAARATGRAEESLSELKELLKSVPFGRLAAIAALRWETPDTEIKGIIDVLRRDRRLAHRDTTDEET